MSQQYDEYLQQHKENVGKGLDWIREYLPGWLTDGIDWDWQIKMQHDQSKSSPEEYQAYDDYFYGGNRSYSVVEAFRYAWLHHIHNNPHHWQYWILVNDDPDERTIYMTMPYNYIVEMICDWWSFCWNTGDLTGIFDWYSQHETYIKFDPITGVVVSSMLNELKDKIQEVQNDK